MHTMYIMVAQWYNTQTQVEIHKTQAEIHKTQVKIHKTQAEVHKHK